MKKALKESMGWGASETPFSLLLIGPQPDSLVVVVGAGGESARAAKVRDRTDTAVVSTQRRP